MATKRIIKTYSRKKKREKVDHIDNISKYCQQPRSTPPKRRTDFSNFFSSPSPSNQGSSLGSSCGKDGSSNVTVNSLVDKKGKGKKFPEVPLVRCKKSEDKGLEFSSNFFEVPIVEVESVGHCSSKQKSNAATSLESTPKESQVAETNGLGIIQGSVVWAKTASQTWWPAEIMGERSTPADSRNQGADGHVLVQFYGKNHSAWVDPARDLSQLEDSFEERSCNPMEEFQDALKQALDRKDRISSGRQLCGSPDTSHAQQQDQSSDKTLSTSSRTEGDILEARRGKRERKPKVRFDEVTFPPKSAKKGRRFKIMRYLGLAAPIGSPF